ncbi:MAG: hypothetical protein ACRC06_01135 [Waterburya sp.]
MNSSKKRINLLNSNTTKKDYHFKNLSDSKKDTNDWLEIIKNQLNINKNNLPFALLTGAALVYFGIHDTLFVCTLGAIAILFMGMWQISRAIPIVNRFVGSKISFWHVCVLILGTVMALSQFEPAHALFLDKLQTAVEGTISASGNIDKTIITNLFNLIRVIFLFLVVGAGIFAYSQAQQGNDWRPIIIQVGLAIAVVIVIDLLSVLFLG